MLSRRGLITGLVSLLAAPAIVRASSLDTIRGVPLLVYEPQEVALGYTIIRKAIDQRLYAMSFAQLKAEGALIEYDHIQDAATIWCDPDFAGLLGRS
jgi:hypothetical protein